MSRSKKDGRFFTVYIDRVLYERLKSFADAKGQTRTMALERILQEYLDLADNHLDFKMRSVRSKSLHRRNS